MIGKQFRGGRQEDAHEFLILLLDAMQVCDGDNDLLRRLTHDPDSIQASCLRVAGVSATSRLARTTMVHAMFR